MIISEKMIFFSLASIDPQLTQIESLSTFTNIIKYYKNVVF